MPATARKERHDRRANLRLVHSRAEVASSATVDGDALARRSSELSEGHGNPTDLVNDSLPFSPTPRKRTASDQRLFASALARHPKLVLYSLRALQVATLAVIGVISVQLYGEITAQVEDPLGDGGLSQPPPVEKPSKEPLAFYSPITSRDIFNPPKPPEAPVAPKVPYLTAKLLGTAPSAVEGKGFAVFEVAAKRGASPEQDLYRVGDVLQGRTITEIGWGEVTLVMGEKTTTLEVPLPSREVLAAAHGGGVIEEEPSGLLDPAQLSGTEPPPPARADAVYDKGVFSGLRIAAVVGGSPYAKLGLRGGDLLTAVNGKGLKDPITALGAFRALGNTEKASLQIRRNGASLTLPIDEEGAPEPTNLASATAVSRLERLAHDTIQKEGL